MTNTPKSGGVILAVFLLLFIIIPVSASVVTTTIGPTTSGANNMYYWRVGSQWSCQHFHGGVFTIDEYTTELVDDSGYWYMRNGPLYGETWVLSGTYTTSQHVITLIVTDFSNISNCRPTTNELYYFYTYGGLQNFGAGGTIKFWSGYNYPSAPYVLPSTSSPKPMIGTHIQYYDEDVPQTPTADFTSNVTNIYMNDYVQFYDTSINSPDCWLWYFDKELPSFPPSCLQAADSTEQNPVKQFTTYGYHNVSLIVINDYGYDSETKENYIFANSNDCYYVPTLDISENVAYPTVNQNVTFSITTSINPTFIIWGFTDQENYAYPKNIYSYMKNFTTGLWYQWNENTNEYDILTSYSNVVNQVRSFKISSETYEKYDPLGHSAYVRVEDENCSVIRQDTEYYTVTGFDSKRQLKINFINSLTGGYLNDVNLNVWEYSPNNQNTSYSNADTPTFIQVYREGLYSFTVNKTGFNNATRNYIMSDSITEINLYLYPTCSAPSGYACLNVQTYWGFSPSYPVSNAKVIVSYWNNKTLTQYTNTQGNTMFYVPENTNVYYSITASGYEDAAGLISVTTGNTVETVYLIPLTTTYPTPTTTVPPTSIPPTISPSGAAGGLVDLWAYYMGVPAWMILAMLALIISMICAGLLAYVAGYGGGTGAGMAAAIGFVGAFVCCSIAWRELIIFDIVIIIGGVAIIVFMGRGGGGG